MNQPNTDRFRKLPVEIEAIRFDGTPQSILAVMRFVDAGRSEKELRIHAETDPSKSWIGIPTLEGTMRADAGDWIIRGVKAELYPCKPDVFATTYEPVTREPAAVLPPVDRAAVLREAADRYAALVDQNEAYELAEHGAIDHESRLQFEAVRDVVTGLRRMADEELPATEAPKLQPVDAEDAPPVEPCPPGCVACATDESHDPAPADRPARP